MMDLFAAKPGLPAGHVEMLVAIARQHFGVDDGTTVKLFELVCSEPGCPPLETVIALLRPEGNRQYKVHKALADLTPADIEMISS